MWTLLLPSLALAANLVIDVKVPVEVWLDGELAGQAVLPCELHYERPAGPAELILVIAGRNQPYRVDVPESGVARVVVGRTGVTLSEDEASTPAAEPAAAYVVEIRSASREDLVVVLAGKRLTLAPHEVRTVDLAPGTHTLSVRNPHGTVVWAQGKLHVLGAGLVVQLTDGRMPEVSGNAGTFQPDHR